MIHAEKIHAVALWIALAISLIVLFQSLAPEAPAITVLLCIAELIDMLARKRS